MPTVDVVVDVNLLAESAELVVIAAELLRADVKSGIPNG